MDDVGPRRWGGMRLTVLVIAGIEALLIVILVLATLGGATSSEALSRSISQGVMTLAGAFAIPVLAALVLAFRNRWLWVALVLSLAVLAAPVLLFPYL